MKKNSLLTASDVRQRINRAVEDICSDLSDMAKLHNQLCQGKVEIDENIVVVFRCVEGDE